MAIPELPDDILHVLCAELAQQRDFDTLFTCCVSSRRFAIPALTHLYRIHHLSPVRDGGNEAVPIAEQQLVVQKWSILWRSIIASSLGKTLYPYCRYIRVLDLRDLTNLLEEDKFRGKVQANFFSRPLSKFQISVKTPSMRKPGSTIVRTNVNAVIDSIGEAVTEHTPMLEQISGNISSNALVLWAPRLPRLRSLELWDGRSLADDRVPQVIRSHCPLFEGLSFYTWQGDDPDGKLAALIETLKPHTLRSLVMFSDASIGKKTFAALETQCNALKELKLYLKKEALPHIGLLKNCKALETLLLVDSDQSAEVDSLNSEAFHETSEWLRECTSLRNLSFATFVSAASIATPLLLQDHVQLTSLQVDGYIVKDNREFHKALTHQKNLRSLYLSGASELMTRDDIDILVESLQQLTELRKLVMIGVSDFLNDEHINAITGSLAELEDLYIGGLAVTDLALEGVSKLRNLRSLTFNVLSSFTANGLLDFIAALGPGNQGLTIMVDMAEPYGCLTEDEQNIVRAALAAKVGGRFEYVLWRDPEVSEFEEGDSD